MEKIHLEWVVITVLVTLIIIGVAMTFKKPEKELDHAVAHSHAISDPGFQREMGVLMGPAILDGNRITPLQNGDEIFPAMLAAIRGARRTITFETYIYWSGQIGDEFAKALEERARAGVEVRVILDWFGSSKMDDNMLAALKQAGVQVEKYHPLSWYNIVRYNNRTHRKLLVVDGTIGFTGGVGIADSWQGHAQDPDHWRDMHFKVEGPVVAEMQSAFLDNWIKTTGSVLHGDGYFPQLQKVGDERAHLFISSPAGGSASMHLMYLLSIAAATKTIDLSSAYFVPDDLTVGALVAAMQRGVRLRIITPGPIIDSQTVRGASRAAWGPLLEAGAEISEYQPTMFHCKVFTVDGLLVSVGSTNFDNRSFRLNDEANLNIYDEAFAAGQTAQFEADLRLSKRLTYEAWKDRPLREKAMEHVAALLSSQL